MKVRLRFNHGEHGGFFGNGDYPACFSLHCSPRMIGWFIGLFLAAVSLCQAGEARSSVDSLDDAQVQKALEAVRGNFLSAEQIDKVSQRALLLGLIETFGPGVSLVEAEKEATAPRKIFPFLAEILDGRAGYIRPGTLDSAALSQMDSALGNFREKSIGAVILDLRGMPVESAFEGCAEFAKRFCPKGAVLFTIQKPNAKQERIVTNDRVPGFEGVLVVLVDADTEGAGEALAATLRENAKAMVVGDQTAGGAAEFAELPIGGGRSVRVAVSQVLMPKSGALFPEGVKPDIAVRLARESRDVIFEKSREEGVGRFAFDVEPPRMNEAALVAKTNPEIAEDRSSKSEPSLRDTVLQRALDLVTAIGFFKK